jgi:formylglycine-generating enzyme required for sulfatase activity
LDEWFDNYQNSPTDGSARGNVTSRDNSKGHILRGGSWVGDPSNCRSANRYKDDSETQDNYIGFRVVCAQART